MAHPLSLAFLTVSDVGPAEAVRVAAETGYAMVGLRLLPAAAGEGAYPLLTEKKALAEVIAALDDTGVAVGDVEIARLKAETDVDDFALFLDRASKLRARHVLVAGDDPEPDRLTETFAGFCRLAAEHGITADLEFMPWTKVPDVAMARRIVGAAGASNGGVLVDALHFDRCGSTFDELRALRPEWIHYAQLCDGPAEYDPSDEGMIKIARGGRLDPGEGGIDLVGLVRTLPVGATISVEVPNLARAERMSAVERARSAAEATKRVLEAAGRSVRAPS